MGADVVLLLQDDGARLFHGIGDLAEMWDDVV